jgi:hypothetical protein
MTAFIYIDTELFHKMKTVKDEEYEFRIVILFKIYYADLQKIFEPARI